MFDYDVKCVYCFSKIDFRKILFEKKEVLSKLNEVHSEVLTDDKKPEDKVSLDKVSLSEKGKLMGQGGMNSKRKQSQNKQEALVSGNESLICFGECIDENLNIRAFKTDGKE